MSENNKALATVDPNVFLTFDRLDDDQIIAEMKGAALQEYVYEFTEGGQQVRGLSKAGTDDASRIMAVKYGEALREIDVILESQTEDEALFKAKVERWVIRDDGTPMQMDSAIGQKRQGKKLVRRDGKVIPNSFWYEQGGQKALRNAKQKLMPETIKQAIIAAYIEQGKVRKVKPEDIAPAESNGQTTEQEHWCPIHNVPFRRQQSRSDPNKHWYSHKDGDSWCNEAKAREVEPEQPKANGHTQAPKPIDNKEASQSVARIRSWIKDKALAIDGPDPKAVDDDKFGSVVVALKAVADKHAVNEPDLFWTLFRTRPGQGLTQGQYQAFWSWAKSKGYADGIVTVCKNLDKLTYQYRVDHEPPDQRPDTEEDGAVPGIDELETDAAQAGMGL